MSHPILYMLYNNQKVSFIYLKPAITLLIWLSLLPIAGAEYIQESWERLLVVFAAMVLIPIGVPLLGIKWRSWYWLMVAAFCLSFLIDTPGTGFSDLLALPYLILSASLAITAAVDMMGFSRFNLLELVRVFALGYWATGAFWALCSLAGFQPWDFDPVIVTLTAAHFHVAGFVFATAGYKLLQFNNNRSTRLLGLGLIAGMPLVAFGITASKLGMPSWIESCSGLFFVMLALLLGYLHVKMAFHQQINSISRWCWGISSICLFAGMCMAAMYALRFYYPMPFFQIPNMKIWHGSINAIGFGWLVLIGWNAQTRIPALQSPRHLPV